MYKNTNCFHLAVPCGDLEIAKKFYSETLGCRLDNSAQEWADVDFWGNELHFMRVNINLIVKDMMLIWVMFLSYTSEFIYQEKILMLLKID